jgi:hypothetical protein
VYDEPSALVNCTDADYVVTFTFPHFDLIAANRAMLQLSPVKWIPRKVFGHQDNDLTAFLDRWAILNIEMDDRAKLHWGDGVHKPRDSIRGHASFDY